MSSTEIKLLCSSLNEVINLKLSDSYPEKYNELLSHLSDVLLAELENNEGHFSSIIKLNCMTIRVTAEFCKNPNSKHFQVVEVTGAPELFQSLLHAIEGHLNFYETVISSTTFKELRLNAILKLNCEVFQSIFKLHWDNDSQLYDKIINLLCENLYEIVTKRIKLKYHFRFEVLMQHHAKALVKILKCKIDTLDQFKGDVTYSNIQDILKMHNTLYTELNAYIEATADSDTD